MRPCGVCLTLYPGICPEADDICLECRSEDDWIEGDHVDWAAC